MFLTIIWTMIVLISLKANCEAYLLINSKYVPNLGVEKMVRRHISSDVHVKHGSNNEGSMPQALNLPMYLTRGFAINEIQFKLVVMEMIHLGNLNSDFRFDARPLPQKSQLKISTQQLSSFPVFRFYYPVNRGYMSPGNKSKEITTMKKDPFSFDIEWEWLAQPQQKGFYLRNKRSGSYLCFNQNGRPSSRKQVKMPNCLLHGSLPRFSFNVKQQKTGGFGAYTSNQTFSLGGRSKKTAFQKNKTDNEWIARNPFPPLGRADRLPHFAIPTLLRLYSKQPKHNSPMSIGFCENGRAFANKRPYSGPCSHSLLPKLWDTLLICPPITPYCRQHCRHADGLLLRRSKFPQVNCPEQCRFSVSCGQKPNVFQMKIDAN